MYVHRNLSFYSECFLYWLTVLVHAHTQTAAMCVSGCGGGVVCYWELSTGNCRHMLQEGGGEGEEFLLEGVAVIKLDISVGGAVVGLMSDETVVVWDKSSGESLYTIALVSCAVSCDNHML